MTMDVNVGGYLAKAFAEGYAAHAYIVVGEKPVLPALLKQCATVVMCARHVGCGCEACSKVKSNSHQDVICLPRDNAKNKLTVADMAYLVEESVKRPVDNSPHRVFLVDASNSASGIGSDVWQNKLLKTLEEPIDGVFIFIGVTDAESLLPTIRSRCQVLKQSKNTVTEVKFALRGKGFDATFCEMAAAMSGGSVDTAERILHNPAIFRVYDLAKSMAVEMTSTKVALKYASAILTNKDYVADFLGFFTLLLRESIVVRLAPNLAQLPSFADAIGAICQNYTLSAAENCIQLVNDYKKMLDDGANLTVTVDKLLNSVLEMKYKCRQ